MYRRPPEAVGPDEYTAEIVQPQHKKHPEIPELSARIFVANRFEGLTYQEISEKYNISVRKVTREIQRCLEMLRKDLGEYLYVAIMMFPSVFM